MTDKPIKWVKVCPYNIDFCKVLGPVCSKWPIWITPYIAELFSLHVGALRDIPECGKPRTPEQEAIWARWCEFVGIVRNTEYLLGPQMHTVSIRRLLQVYLGLDTLTAGGDVPFLWDNSHPEWAQFHRDFARKQKGIK